MTDTERKIINILNEYAKETFEVDEDVLEPVEIDDSLCEIPTYPFEGIMENDDDPFSQNYNGPEILTYIQFSEGKEIYSGAYCIGNFTDEQKAVIREYSARLDELGEELEVQETDEGLLIEVGILMDSEDEGWEERFLANLESGQDDIGEVFETLVYAACYRMMGYAMDITSIINGSITIDQVIEATRKALEASDAIE